MSTKCIGVVCVKHLYILHYYCELASLPKIRLHSSKNTSEEFQISNYSVLHEMCALCADTYL